MGFAFYDQSFRMLLESQSAGASLVVADAG